MIGTGAIYKEMVQKAAAGVSPFLKNKRIATLAGTLASDRQLRRHF